MQGMNPGSSCDSGLLYRLWLVGGGLGPGSPGPSSYAPVCHQGADSARGRARTREQCAGHAGRGSSGYQNTQLFSQTLVLDSTGLELLGDELGPQDLAQEPAWVPKSC